MVRSSDSGSSDSTTDQCIQARLSPSACQRTCTHTTPTLTDVLQSLQRPQPQRAGSSAAIQRCCCCCCATRHQKLYALQYTPMLWGTVTGMCPRHTRQQPCQACVECHNQMPRNKKSQAATAVQQQSTVQADRWCAVHVCVMCFEGRRAPPPCLRLRVQSTHHNTAALAQVARSCRGDAAQPLAACPAQPSTAQPSTACSLMRARA